MSDAAADLRAMIAAYWKPHAICAAARLGLADALGDASLDAATLAAKIDADAANLERFLRALASIGIVLDKGDGTFALTEMGQRLRADHAESLRGMARHVGTQLSPSFAQLTECVAKGRPPEGIAYGTQGFDDLNDDAKAAAIFNQAMVDSSRRFAAEAVQAYDVTGFASFADIGGGHGMVLAELLKAAPDATGFVLDLPHAEEGAKALFARQGVADRARFVGGSFFDPITHAADCYMLKYILHDWDDEHARQIIRRVGAAARDHGATVLLIERILPETVQERGDHAIAMYGDMTMMLWNGRERTKAQFEQLLAEGDLVLTRTAALSDNHYVIEALSN
ncbi:methyltransferase [Alteraurantiacibacter aestuarii]|uniref:Hydroxyneurosporene methyltransferase n=1 Tax=Alteraurantiacibacter aestuarii TaxID=650004 RepID=A0A844ZHM9_9SPHN|nr:methyltransferase [Alteraurantiacibacter aestuarii]MXO87288.1 hydroxyneurosporene methyltransferase [Alteraurantiacibacter aestuarii]